MQILIFCPHAAAAVIVLLIYGEIILKVEHNLCLKTFQINELTNAASWLIFVIKVIGLLKRFNL